MAFLRVANYEDGYIVFRSCPRHRGYIRPHCPGRFKPVVSSFQQQVHRSSQYSLIRRIRCSRCSCLFPVQSCSLQVCFDLYPVVYPLTPQVNVMIPIFWSEVKVLSTCERSRDSTRARTRLCHAHPSFFPRLLALWQRSMSSVSRMYRWEKLNVSTDYRWPCESVQSSLMCHRIDTSKICWLLLTRFLVLHHEECTRPNVFRALLYLTTLSAAISYTPPRCTVGY